MISEFIDAYSDDQIYLDMLEDLVNSQPFEAAVPSSIRYSSFARLWAVMMVGGVECMIKEWAGDQSAQHDVYSYFEEGSNIERVERLRHAFSIRGINFNIEHFEDFLAVKFIRNAYVHSEWKQDQRKYVVKRGFPGTLISFEAEHFMRMKTSYLHVMQCLGMANAATSLLRRDDS